jgi:hypothetical protein
MDISLNMIDLEYLMNPAFSNLRVNQEEDVNLKSDIEFYKKRIFKLTKDLLRNTSITTQVDEGFREYARICIKHFKFIDKSDIIQKQYNHHKKVKPKSAVPNKEFPDHLLMRGARAIQRTIPECIPVKVKNEKKKIVFMPQSHEVDLKDPAFKIKGLGKKNMHNKYEKDKKKMVKKNRKEKKKK